MNSLGLSSVTSSRSSAPVSRSLVRAVTPWALTRTRLRIAEADRDHDQAGLQRVLHPCGRAGRTRHAQGEEQDVASLDDQRLGAVGAGHQLAPEDRVGPGLAVRLAAASDPPVGPPGDVQARRRPGSPAVLRARWRGRRRRRPGLSGKRRRRVSGRPPRPSPPGRRRPAPRPIPPRPRPRPVSRSPRPRPSRSSRGSFRPGVPLRGASCPEGHQQRANVRRQRCKPGSTPGPRRSTRSERG